MKNVMTGRNIEVRSRFFSTRFMPGLIVIFEHVKMMVILRVAIMYSRKIKRENILIEAERYLFCTFKSRSKNTFLARGYRLSADTKICQNNLRRAGVSDKITRRKNIITI